MLGLPKWQPIVTKLVCHFSGVADMLLLFKVCLFRLGRVFLLKL
jgi:membrane protein YqaA with SNARE-associated domain